MNKWEQVDALLALAQQIIDEIIEANDDSYGLLGSAKDHIISARGDMDADLK